MSTKDRLKEFINYLGINISSFEKIINTSNGYVNSISKGIGSDKLEIILENYPNLSIEWLLTGKGEMLKSNSIENILSEPSEKYNKNSDKKLLEAFPVIEIDAMAGYGNGDSQVMKYDLISNYRIPELEGKGVKYLIRVSGSSMYPKYSNGDLLACKPLKDKTFFQWGKPYVLDTEQGAIVKRLFPCKDDDNCLECHSDNITHYPPFKIPKDSIRAIAIVVGVIRLE